tara:strand:+ start:7176 stop:7499 length:324 start_codon:yes stop_codon:yes gene_type:complete
MKSTITPNIRQLDKPVPAPAVKEVTPITPVEAGGAHYGDVQPWDLQRKMPTSGNAFVDGRRCDVIKYAFRMKGDDYKLLDDLKKAQHCIEVAIECLEEELSPFSKAP